MKNQENVMLKPLSSADSAAILGGSIFHSLGSLTKKAWCALQEAYTSFKESPGGGQSGVVGINTYGGSTPIEA
ncbi:MAG: hypothetical protein ACXIT9_11130 [Nitritalea sp.]